MSIATRSITLAAALCVILCAIPTVSVAAPTYAQLVQQNRTFRADNTRLRALAASRLEAVERMRTLTAAAFAARNRAIAARDTAIEQRNAAITERDTALQGLPAAISVVPVEDFWRLVFAPARDAWPCDSFYTDGDYWSLDFTRISAYC